MFQLFFVALALIAGSIHLAVSPKRRGRGSAIAGTYLIYLFVIYVGLMGVLTAYAHVFRPAANVGKHWLVDQSLRI